MRSALLALAGVITAALSGAAVSAQVPTAAGTVETAAATPQRPQSSSFSLELGSDRQRSRRALLGPERPADHANLVAAWFPGVLLPNRSALAGSPRFTLGVGMSLVFAAGARPPLLSLGPWNRSWDDLDAWEKVGVVLQTAGGIVAAARLAEIVVHQFKK